MPEPNEPEQIVLMRQMVDMAAQRTKMATERTKLANDRTKMSAERSDMAAARTYMAAERTLSVWIRTALSLMVFGIAIDRFGLLLRQLPRDAGNAHLHPDTFSAWGGAALVLFGVVMALTTGVRFMAYVVAYRRRHELPLRHGPFLAPIFALLVAVFGIGLLVLLLVFAG